LEGQDLGYGWSYESNFDSPEAEDEDTPYVDEDELYAKGMDKE